MHKHTDINNTNNDMHVSVRTYIHIYIYTYIPIYAYIDIYISITCMVEMITMRESTMFQPMSSLTKKYLGWHYLHIYMYIYIYRERERGREKCIHIYTCIYTNPRNPPVPQRTTGWVKLFLGCHYLSYATRLTRPRLFSTASLV